MRDLRRLSAAFLALSLLTSCVHSLSLYSQKGERFEGRWRFAREGSGLIQVFGPDGEVLVGTFRPVGQREFFANYQKTFGAGSIDLDGPELSAYGHGLLALSGSRNALVDAAHGKSYNRATGQSLQVVQGPLFYWTAYLQGDKRTVMRCFLIGSSHSGHGLGRCKGAASREYTVEF